VDCLKESLKSIGFIFVTIGFLGLILGDFAFNWGTAITLAFAFVNVLGLIMLAVAHWGIK
jgi:hypothetical protein